ncbi:MULTISPECIES: MFS transporter [Bacteria]|jgi:MFS family permease|uniref:MFS transporter n=1 Tax=Merismopedia glauca CCAP 1448/3 TaxID=1296344 RepID=A0A2T1C5S6_9CYAN|nr:MFS transporter [Merismopedia glauca]PSB03596.1 MFS transporter [Merismopedia glauca CCAP 1448/3]
MNVQLGLRENWKQFSLLILINAFVGGMIGVERTVVPLIGKVEFHIESTTLITSFIISFGLVKAFANLISGQLADYWGRKQVLILGWMFGLPVPFLIIAAPSWNWIIGANILLGLSQGFAWSMTVIMKVDLVGPKGRGTAVGLNEFAGYFSVGVTALVTGYLASSYGLRPVPILLGVVYAVAGSLLTLLLVRDTSEHVKLEARINPKQTSSMTFKEVFLLTSFKDRNLFAASQAGMINNLNDGMSWGILPLFFNTFGLSVANTGLLRSIHPMVWGIGQLVTGPLSDRWGRKGLIVVGMWIQGIALILTAVTDKFEYWFLAAMMMGIGTAMVYPSLIAAVSDASHPTWRAKSLSVYRFWRDLGYAIGALSAGIMADRFGFSLAITVIGVVSLISGVVVAFRMQER